MNGTANGYEWVNAQLLHYDSIGNAFMSTFVISSGGWGPLLRDTLAATEIDKQPSPGANFGAFAYFAVGVVAFGFFLNNLFIGVLHESYMRLRSIDPEVGGMLMSGEDRRWNEFEQQLRAEGPVTDRPAPPRGGLRARLFQLAEGRAFEFCLTLTLLANAIMLCTQHAGEPRNLTRARAHSEVAFTVIYVVEIVVKLGGYGWRGFTSNSHDNVAAFCMLSSVIDSALYLSHTSCGHDTGAASMLRLFRALRLLRLLRLAARVPGLELFTTAASAALPLIGRIAIVIMMEVLVFAQVGVALFHDVDFTFGGRNTNASFQNTFRAMQLLWLAGTGEMWVEFMQKASHELYWTSAFFFGSFLLSMQFIMLNLFTMVITEAFEVLRDESRAHINALVPVYKSIWHHFDPQGTGFISREKLVPFVSALPPPLGIAAHHKHVPHVAPTRRCCAKSKAKANKKKKEKSTLVPGAENSRRRAHVLLSQPMFAVRCGFVDTLVALSALHLASAEGISVPADFQEDAVEIAVALVVVKQALRGYVRRRRAAFADAAATGQPSRALYSGTVPLIEGLAASPPSDERAADGVRSESPPPRPLQIENLASSVEPTANEVFSEMLCSGEMMCDDSVLSQVQPSTDHADLTFCALEQGVMLNDSPSGSAVCCAPDEPPLDRRLVLDARVEETRRNLAKLLKERADLEHLEQPSAASRGANEKPTRVFLY